MAASTVIKHDQDGVIKLTDGTGTPVTLVVPFSQGDFSVSGIAKTLKEIIKYESRGVLHTVRYGARTYPSGSFTAMLADISDATDGTVIDYIRRTGLYATNVSTLGATADVYAITLTLTIEGSDHDDSADHTIVLTSCVCTVDVSEGQPNTITVNFECLGTVTMT